MNPKFSGPSPTINYEYVNNDYSSSSGLPIMLKFFEGHFLYNDFLNSLPLRVSNASSGSDVFGKQFLLSFMEGHECLDDLEEFEEEPLVRELLGGRVMSIRACGDFLRDFKRENLDKLNKFQRDQARSYRKQLEGKTGKEMDLIIDMDSTFHEQQGKKMEGLEMNRDGKIGFDSLLTYDDLGFNHAFEFRSGATFSSQNAPKMINFVFSDLELKKKKFYRADSAFCNEECINALMNKSVKFVIAAHGNTNWESHINEITSWSPWIYDEDFKKSIGNRKARMPKVELGSFIYHPGWGDGKLGFTCVVKRTWVEAKEGMFSETQGWKYYAVLTNAHGTTFTNLQSIMEFYHQRGNSENFIRDDKYGFDLKHFPCQKFLANEAYGRLALVTHNIIRLSSLLTNPNKPAFAKKMRRKYIKIAGELRYRSRQIFLRVPNYVKKEVEKLKQLLRPGAYDLGLSTA